MHINTKVKRPTGRMTPVIRKMVDGELKEVRRYDTFDNVITNEAMLYIFNDQHQKSLFNPTMFDFRYMKLGDGTAPYTPQTTDMGGTPTANTGQTDTDVQFFLDVVEEDGSYFVLCQNAYVFGLGSVVGTFTEIATMRSTNGPSPTFPVFSGTLIKDSAGDPVSITVGADEQLIVYYDFRFEVSQKFYNDAQGNSSWVYHADPANFPATIDVGGQTHNVTATKSMYKLYRIGGDAADTTSRQFYVLRSDPDESQFDSARVYSTTSSAALSSGDSNGEVTGTKTVAADNLSMSHDATLVIAPAAGLDNLEKVEMLNWSSNSSNLTLEFDPPIPIPAGDRLTLSFTVNYDWSGS